MCAIQFRAGENVLGQTEGAELARQARKQAAGCASAGWQASNPAALERGEREPTRAPVVERRSCSAGLYHSDY